MPANAVEPSSADPERSTTEVADPEPPIEVALAAPRAAVAEPSLEPTDITADPALEPEPTVSVDDLAEALATIDIHAIPIEPPSETDQMRLF